MMEILAPGVVAPNGAVLFLGPDVDTCRDWLLRAGLQLAAPGSAYGWKDKSRVGNIILQDDIWVAYWRYIN